MGVKSLFSNVAYNFLVVSELWRFGCKAESKLQRLRAIHNVKESDCEKVVL